MKKINYGLIVSDFDGTLASSDGTISEKNKNAIFEYINAGGIFALSTGRMPATILPQMRKLGIKGLLCCGHGTVILDIESGEIIFENRLPLETTLEVCRKMEEMDLVIAAFDLWDFYSNRDGNLLKFYEKLANSEATLVYDRPLSRFLEEKKMAAYKLLAIVEPKDNDEIFAKLTSLNIPDCAVTKSMDYFVEIVNSTLNKGTSVSYLAENYGIPMDKTIAIGDNFNDISMIERAALGVAVGNAEGVLKNCADYVCKCTNEESAVAEVIEKFGFAEN